MRTYFVTRHGSNAANQSMTPVAVIGRVEASSYDVAMKRAKEKFGDKCYNNQYLGVKAASRFPREERDAAWEFLAEAGL